ncbi:MAG: DUF4446 family protein [Candidatus Paceibacterota bacterium]
MNIDLPVSLDILVIAVIVVLVALVLFLIYWIIRIERKFSILLATKNAETLEDTLVAIYKNLDKLNGFREKTETHINDLENRMQTAVRGVETVRFNPFAGDGSGGNHSFATALISERGDGIVLSSLYARERTNVFSKRVTSFKPHQELSEEEQNVIDLARVLTQGNKK